MLERRESFSYVAYVVAEFLLSERAQGLDELGSYAELATQDGQPELRERSKVF